MLGDLASIVTSPIRATGRLMFGDKKLKVAVVGAAGGIGQPLSLLLKLSPFVHELSLFDVAPFTPGVGVDLSHADTSCKVSAFVPSSKEDTATIDKALAGCDLVVIPAGVPRKPGMTRDDLFNINAGILAGVCESITRVCPEAWVCIITNPVNSTVPIARNIFKAAGCYNPAKLFGVTTLDCCRANTFCAEIVGAPAEGVTVPVVGGHAGKTILPLLSQCSHNVLGELKEGQLAELTSRIQNAGTEVVEAKAGAGSATLSMAYAAYLFATACLKAMNGFAGVVECAYVEDESVEGCDFFAQRVKLGKQGIITRYGVGKLTEFEAAALEEMKPQLIAEISKGVEWKK